MNLPAPRVYRLTTMGRKALLELQVAALRVKQHRIHKVGAWERSAAECQGVDKNHPCGAQGEFDAHRWFRNYGTKFKPRAYRRILCWPCAERWAKTFGADMPPRPK